MTDTGVHLRRTEENTAEIAALTARLGAPVGLGGVLAALNRTASRVGVPGRLVEWGFRWEDRDVASARWWPQGITNSAHVPGVDRRVLVTSWYSHQVDGRNHGSRITVVDLETLRYRHVLLVVPTVHHGTARMEPLLVHAGGIVWVGPHLHVAGTRRGLFTCRLDDVLEVEPNAETFGHRFVLPVRSAYDARDDREQMRYSFLSLDRSTETPHLVAGEYGRGDMTRRIVRYPLDPQTLRLHADTDGRSRPVSFDERGLGHMQGVAIVQGRYHVTTSRGRWRLGALSVGEPGAFRRLEHATPIGPEDLCYWDGEDELWSLSEYPGHRYVFCVRRSGID